LPEGTFAETAKHPIRIRHARPGRGARAGLNSPGYRRPSATLQVPLLFPLCGSGDTTVARAGFHQSTGQIATVGSWFWGKLRPATAAALTRSAPRTRPIVRGSSLRSLRHGTRQTGLLAAHAVAAERIGPVGRSAWKVFPSRNCC
jgi:hypothetical protein